MCNALIKKSIPRLIKKNIYDEVFLMEGKDGSIYFDTTSIPAYGDLSNQKLDALEFEKGEGKKSPADFALWKKTTQGITFNSP